jgi:hypothetical protein
MTKNNNGLENLTKCRKPVYNESIKNIPVTLVTEYFL